MSGSIGIEPNIDHLAAHRVSPREAEAVFLGDPVDLDYQFEDEDRWVAVGQTKRGRCLVICLDNAA